MPATPMLLDGVPCLALPYAERTRAAALRAARETAFAVTDARSLSGGDRGVLAFGAVTVVDDLDGSVFTDKLLEQELVKYPPARALADNLLLRRENWWWLPRLIVRLERVDRTVEPAARTNPAAEALLVRNGLGMRVDTVSVAAQEGRRLGLASSESEGLRGDTGPALVIGHDYTDPDFERWESWRRRGRLRGDTFLVEGEEGQRGVPLPPLGLIERIRRRRALERACRGGIAGVERGDRAGDPRW